MSFKNFRSVSVALAIFFISAAYSSQAQATSYFVNATTGVDINTCTTAASPCLTIQGAVDKATADGDDIQVAAGTYPASIIISPVAVTRVLKIAGAGANTTIVDGGNTNRGFEVRGGVTLDLSKLTIQNCSGGGGGDDEGGGIRNLGTVKLSDCAVINNNKLIPPNPNVTGSHGGGIFNGKRALTVPSEGVMDIINCTISGNNVPVRGGGVSNGGGEPDAPDDYKGTMTITNSTISGNSSGVNNPASDKGGGGGGIYNHTGSTLSLFNVTIANNTANPTASGPNGGGGVHTAGTLNVKNSLIATNKDTSTTTAPDCFGTLSSGGFNLVGNNNACGFTSSSGDQVGTAATPVNPLLGALALNAPGTTMTQALLANSPAIDKGNSTACVDKSGATLPTDQRGSTRPVAGIAGGSVICDIGAYEAAAGTTPSGGGGGGGGCSFLPFSAVHHAPFGSSLWVLGGLSLLGWVRRKS